METIQIIIPVFNEEENIENIVNEINIYTKSNDNFKILIIDDGSRDKSWEIIKTLSEKDNVNGIRFTRNFGKDAAILAGLIQCKSDYAIIMDGDLQHSPIYIEELIKKIKSKNYDIVSGIKLEKTKKIFHKLFYKLFFFLTNINLEAKSDFKIINKRVINYLQNIKEKNFFLRGMVEWSGFKQSHIDIEINNRKFGKTKYNFLSLINFGFNIIFSYSTKPIRVITIFGIIFLFLSSLLFFRVIYLKLFDSLSDGYTTLISFLLILLSFIILSLGIIGEYIAKIYTEAKERPLYIIQDKTFDE